MINAQHDPAPWPYETWACPVCEFRMTPEHKRFAMAPVCPQCRVGEVKDFIHVPAKEA